LTGAHHEHVAHLIDACAKSCIFAPAFEQMTGFTFFIRQGLSVTSTGNAGPIFAISWIDSHRRSP